MATLKKVLPLLHPVPIVLIGTYVEGKLNYTTVGDVAVAGLNPPLIMISLHVDHFSTRGIKEHEKFSVNVPDRAMLELVDYCGIKSGKTVDKGELILTKEGIEAIPYAEMACTSLLCRVEKSVVIETRTIFIGRVLETILRDDLAASGHIDFKKVNSILYGLNNKYYSVGKEIGIGYFEGKKLEDV
jgi:flavin reductase (DIM6/NTAB) family NADH-FMN oxidoreductase RutF